MQGGLVKTCREMFKKRSREWFSLQERQQDIYGDILLPGVNADIQKQAKEMNRQLGFMYHRIESILLERGDETICMRITIGNPTPFSRLLNEYQEKLQDFVQTFEKHVKKHGGITSKKSKQYLHFIGQTRGYCVFKDKNNKKYITLNGKTVYLSDIRGQYRYKH